MEANMILRSITVKNYRSFGEKQNNLNINNDITAIIGMNESGKSNLLMAIEHLDFSLGIIDKDFWKQVNRNTMNPVEIIAVLDFTDREQSAFESSEQTVFIYRSAEETHMEGGLSEYFSRHKCFLCLRPLTR